MTVCMNAHGIQATGPCHVSGQHLSQAPNDLASPQACEARAQRIAAANQRHTARQHGIRTAKALIQQHGVRGPWELMEMLQVVQSSFVGDSLGEDYSHKLAELIRELDEAMQPEPELQAFDKRGEFDAFTPNVQHRSQA